MVNLSDLIGNLTVEDFIFVIVFSLFVFVLYIGLCCSVGVLIAWSINKLKVINRKKRQRDINKIKRECVEDITRYYDDVYKRLEGDDNAKNE